MQGILTFASLGLGLTLTLLFGPQWGMIMGFLVYLAGSNLVLSQKVRQLKAHIDRIVNDLPELLRESSHETNQPAPPPAPAQEASNPKAEAADPLEQRMQALDQKLEHLLQHVQTLAAQKAADAQAAPSPALTATAPTSSPIIIMAMPVPGPSPMASAMQAHQDATIRSAPPEAGGATGDLEMIRELLIQIAEAMSTREDKEDGARQEPVIQAAFPTTPAREDKAVSRRLSIDELRSELDKIAQELSIELGRPKP